MRQREVIDSSSPVILDLFQQHAIDLGQVGHPARVDLALGNRGFALQFVNPGLIHTPYDATCGPAGGI